MHIPDSFLDVRTAALTGALAAAGLALALAHARRTLPPRKTPLLGLSAAFVFAAQMLNFPVLLGTSGHLVGAVLIAVLLGPSAAVIALSAVLIIQCLMFADGGLTALGANIFNMGLIGGVGGWLIYRLLTRFFPGLFGRLLAASFAAWFSTVIAAIACAGELAAAGKVPWNLAFPAMAGVHMLIGLGEALITALVLAAIAPIRPELLGLPIKPAAGFPVLTASDAFATPTPTLPHPDTPILPPPASPDPSYGFLILYGLLIALGLALFVSPFACPWPDGLDHFAQSIGLKEQPATRPAPIPDYNIPGIGSPILATALAGALGTLVVFALSYLLARTLVPKHNKSESA
jgi:cobalt/nickel transport system permease protein